MMILNVENINFNIGSRIHLRGDTTQPHSCSWLENIPFTINFNICRGTLLFLSSTGFQFERIDIISRCVLALCSGFEQPPNHYYGFLVSLKWRPNARIGYKVLFNSQLLLFSAYSLLWMDHQQGEDWNDLAIFIKGWNGNTDWTEGNKWFLGPYYHQTTKDQRAS